MAKRLDILAAVWELIWEELEAQQKTAKIILAI